MPAFVSTLLPALTTIGIWLVAVAVGIAAGTALGWAVVVPFWERFLLIVVVAIGVALLEARAVDSAIGIQLLSRSLAFTILQAFQRTPDFDMRLSEFAEELVAAAKTGHYDEILIVGHSSGAQMAVIVLAKALALDADLGRHGAGVALMTLGQSIPILSWWPQATWFRDAMRRVSWEPTIDWIDFTFPQDGVCYALHDPVESSGLSHPPGVEPKPKLLSLKFFTLVSEETSRPYGATGGSSIFSICSRRK